MNDSSQRFLLLRARYTESLPSKHSALAQAWQSFIATPEEPTRRELQELVHRLAGSASSYGYEPLGDLASAVDRQLGESDGAADASRETASELSRRLSGPMQALLDALAQVAAEAAALPASVPAAGEALRVILVEDDPSQAALIGAELEVRGCVVRIESSAEMLLQSLLIWPCHAVVLDFWLRGETAAEIATILRRDASLVRVAVVCVSIERDPRVLRAAVDAGCDAAVGKAEGTDRLVAVVRECVERRALLSF